MLLLSSRNVGRSKSSNATHYSTGVIPVLAIFYVMIFDALKPCSWQAATANNIEGSSRLQEF